MIRSFTTFHRQLIKDLRGQPHTIRNAKGQITTVNFRNVQEPTDTKNPQVTPMFPGIAARVLAARPNNDWSTVEDEKWIVQSSEAPQTQQVMVANPQATFFLDYRVSVYSQTQPEFDQLVRLIYRIWDVGRGQKALRVQDEDNPAQYHLVDLRIVQLSNRNKPEDGTFLADYLLTCPASIIAVDPQPHPTIDIIEGTVESHLDGDTETISAEITIQFLLQPADAPALSTVTAQIKVADTNGISVAGRILHIQHTGGGQASAQATTDDQGIAEIQWTLGAQGPHSMTISSTGALGSPLQVNINAT